MTTHHWGRFPGALEVSPAALIPKLFPLWKKGQKSREAPRHAAVLAADGERTKVAVGVGRSDNIQH